MNRKKTRLSHKIWPIVVNRSKWYG